MAGGTRWNPRNPPRTGNGAVPSRRAKPLASTQNAPAVTTRGIVRHADGNGREPKPLCTAPPSPDGESHTEVQVRCSNAQWNRTMGRSYSLVR
jgi:hypothetical protein